jgi:hypothetical protein
MYEQEYINMLETKVKELESDLILAQKLLGMFSQRHYADGLTKAQIIKMSLDYFEKINLKFKEDGEN